MSLAVSGLVAVSGCTSSEDPAGNTGSGGAKTGSGGALTGSGGAMGSGGMVGSGGAMGSGGMMMGSGGMVAGSGGAGMDAPSDATKSDGGGSEAGDAAGGAATFTELYTTIFSLSTTASPSSCAGASCHNPGKMDTVDLSTKANAYRTIRAKVTPNNAAGSALITRLKSTNVAQRMPLNKPALSAALIARVTSWIMNGAKDD
ncbi:MAG TPA: hypothetical protein VNO55_02585 [Polyangia bacterium]|nr:hypothetical protein [Polyangia bacterium]